MRIFLPLLCYTVFGSMVMTSNAADTVTVVETSGATGIESTVRSWTRTKLVLNTTPPREMPIESILSLQFARKATPAAGGEPMVSLANGDRLALRPVGVFDDVLTATWLRFPGRPPISIPLESVSSIIFDLPVAMKDRQRLFADLQTLSPGEDIVLLANGDRIQGSFERLDATAIHLKTKTGVLKVDPKRVRALRMNPDLTNPAKVTGTRFVLGLTDGSRLTARSVELDGKDLKCSTFSNLDLVFPFSSVVDCRIYGSHAVPLADREPTQVQFVPFLSAQWSLVKNANVMRGPLAIRGVEFGTGLGMHSRMLATYALSGTEREFRATIGIDDCANGSGSAKFAVELDGRRVWESLELTGTSPAFAIPPLKLAGAKQMTLVVDYGKSADVSDYTDWCDAVLVLENETR